MTLANDFSHMQENVAFFYFEIFLSFYLLVALALIADKFLMPALMNVSRKYSLNKEMTGIVVAMGNLIPDITTTIQSFMRHGVKMTEFGIACNIGVSVFVITVVPATVVLLTSNFSPRAEKTGGSSIQERNNLTPEI